MGFRKKGYSPEITIEVSHPWYPGSVFGFTFPKQLPQDALDAEGRLFGLKDEERGDASRKALIDVVARMVVREPSGFDDFPADVPPPNSRETVGLAERMRGYFDDPTQPELEAIIVSVWRAYRAAAIPSSYVKSLPADGAGSS